MHIRFRLSLFVSVCGFIAVGASACSTNLAARLLNMGTQAGTGDGGDVVVGDAGEASPDAQADAGPDAGPDVGGGGFGGASSGGTGGAPLAGIGGLDAMGGSADGGWDGGKAGAPGQATCLAGTYAIEDPDSGVRQCSPCPRGTFSGDADADTCQPWDECMPGTYVAKSGSSSRNRDCKPCPEGEASDQVNALRCSSPVQCPPGTALVLEARDSGSECEPCPAGSFCPGGVVERTECAVGTWDRDGDAATDCEPWDDCQLGSRVESEGTNRDNRTCTPCVGGFSKVLNAGECISWQTCPKGEYIASLGLPDADQVCEDCAEGSFTQEENLESCTDHRVCAMPGLFRVVKGTPVADSECRPCQGRWSAAADDAESCDVPPPAFQMTNDELVIEAEAYHALITNDSADPWTEATDVEGSGGLVMTTGRDVQLEVFNDPQNSGPGLEYDVNFTGTGDFYLHIRGDSASGGSNSCWASVGGELLTPDFGFPDAPGVWSWVSRLFTVEEPGLSVVGVWLREDGFKFDRIVINRSSSPPGGTGPAIDSAIE